MKITGIHQEFPSTEEFESVRDRSSSEIQIGSWTNGQPLYEKSYEVAPGSGDILVDSALNSTDITPVNGWENRTSSFYKTLRFWTTSDYTQFSITASGLSLMRTGSTYGAKFSVQYIKNSETP